MIIKEKIGKTTLKNVLIVVIVFTKDQQNRKKQKITFVPEVVLQLITILTRHLEQEYQNYKYFCKNS